MYVYTHVYILNRMQGFETAYQNVCIYMECKALRLLQMQGYIL